MSNLDSDASKLCKICNENESKYCCPRCNITYCSLPCYKSKAHVQCSESFYKECFTEELASMDQNSESKKKMLEILSKVHKSDVEMEDPPSDEGASDNQDSDDDDPVPDLAARLQNIDLDNANAVWESLTEDERRDFEAIIADDVTKIVPEWIPWWSYHKKRVIISEITDKVMEEFDYKLNCPTFIKKIKKFSNISKNPPASSVKYNLINVLASYVFTARLFNGDQLNMDKEATSCLISLSNNLNNGANYEDIETAIQAVVQESYNNESFKINMEAQQQIESDLKDVLKGPEESFKTYYVYCCLSDICALLNKYKKSDKEGNAKMNLHSKQAFPYQDVDYTLIPVDKVKIVKKKIEYYLSLIADHGNVLVEVLSKDMMLDFLQ